MNFMLGGDAAEITNNDVELETRKRQDVGREGRGGGGQDVVADILSAPY